jgi:hypothetical protein
LDSEENWTDPPTPAAVLEIGRYSSRRRDFGLADAYCSAAERTRIRHGFVLYTASSPSNRHA